MVSGVEAEVRIEHFYRDLDEERKAKQLAIWLTDELNANFNTLTTDERNAYRFLIQINATRALGLDNRPLLVGRDQPHEASKTDGG